MEKTVKLYLKEKCVWKDYEIYIFTYVIMKCEDNEQIEVPVIEGVAYAPIHKDYYKELLIPLRDTPEELVKNPDIKLIYIEEKK